MTLQSTAEVLSRKYKEYGLSLEHKIDQIYEVYDKNHQLIDTLYCEEEMYKFIIVYKKGFEVGYIQGLKKNFNKKEDDHMIILIIHD